MVEERRTATRHMGHGLSLELMDPALGLESDLEEGCMANDEDKAGERGELHFLAALCD